MAGRYLDTNNFKIDKEFQELLPHLKQDEYKQLEQNILTYGLLDPIKVWCSPDGDNIIIDGHNRYRVIQENNIELNAWTDYKIMSELKTREDVKEWMMEQQLGRRNLSDVEKYEIVQRFKTLIQNKAKQNNSDGGKGLTNLSKVNTRKELAEKVGVSEGTYSKLDKVMQSDNEEVKQKLRKKEISTDKAFRIVNDAPTKTKPEIRTPKTQIEEMDNRISEIEKEEQKLQQEKENILKRRKFVFESLDIKCPVKYRWTDNRMMFIGMNITFYIEYEGHEEILHEETIIEKVPSKYTLYMIPEKYKNDFLMVWEMAYQEHLKSKTEYENFKKELYTAPKVSNPLKDELFKAGFTQLAKKYHPDNGGDVEKMKELNKLMEELSK
ncbi:ParB N-terminal domain-containing protein [Anaerotignum sp.]|uniref:ParB N-terminal domain-containing protein n=1 Tax=Anaerotignum sp. TaxID=2039241 RepID=UPI003328D475